MSRRQFLSRREFLCLSAMASGAVALSACGAQPSPTPTTAAKPAATQVAAATTPVPTAPPAAAATKAPVATEAPKVGKHLIGTLEGPELIRDTAKYPKKFAEAPMLADLVKAGKLPPVEQRVPEDPMVIKPLQGIGKYGGTWRRGFTGPADSENGNRINSTDKLLFVDYKGLNTNPCVAKDWKASDDGKTFTLTLRKGMKWSDGSPFTANDFMFWYEDIYQNKDLFPTPNPELSIKGKPGTIKKTDDYTVVFEFPEAYWVFEELLRGDSQVGGGHARGGTLGGGVNGTYAPAAYLKQFHPKYVAKDKLDQVVKDAKFDSWVSMFKFKNDWSRNPELPTVTPWKTTSPITGPNWVLERNPFYWAVDSEGNQLPYIDKISMTLAENLEVLNLRAIAGEYDFQGRHIDIKKLPVLVENQQKGNYTIRLDPADYGSDACLMFNQTYDKDPEIAALMNNRDFRRALSLGIDRDQMNEVAWLGIGTPGSCVVSESHPYNPGPEYRKLWSTLDVAKANQMLDDVGLKNKDGEGYRMRKDGKGRLRIEVSYYPQFFDYATVGQMLRDQWRKIGIQADIAETERNLWFTRLRANELQISLNLNTGSEVLWSYPNQMIPVYVDPPQGPLYYDWYATNGAKGKTPTDPQMLKAMDIFRNAAGMKAEDRVKAAKELWKIIIEEQWTIGIVGLSPAVMGVRIVKNNVGNAPQRQSIIRDCRLPGSSHPSTFFFKG